MWSRLRESRSTIPLLVLLMGLSASLATSSFLRQHERDQAAADFRLVVEGLGGRLGERVQRDADLLRLVQSFALTDPVRAEEEFGRFLEPQRRTGRNGLAAVLLVRRFSPEGLRGWRAERAAEGVAPTVHALGDATARHHDVVVRVEPPRGNEPLLGLDLATHAHAAEALDEAAVSGRAAASRPLTWDVEEDGRRVTAVLVALPVFTPGEPGDDVEARLARLHGFVVGLILGDDYLASVFDPRLGAGSRRTEAELELLDDASEETRIGTFGPPAPGDATHEQVEFPAFDRLWILRVRPSRPDAVTVEELLARESTTLPVAVFLVVGLCAGIAWTLSRQTERVRAEVEQRTAELHSKNAQLEASERELAELNERLLEQSNTDALTGVANRRGFEQQLEKERQRTLRTGVPYGLLIFDVDFFKGYNDRYGHAAGDEVLKRVADTLFTEARRIDCVARYGGEEFVVLASGTDANGLLAMGERIRARIQEAGVVNEASPIGLLTISGGGALSSVDAEHAPRPVFEVADRCLYEAKATGRNRVVMRM